MPRAKLELATKVRGEEGVDSAALSRLHSFLKRPSWLRSVSNAQLADLKAGGQRHSCQISRVPFAASSRAGLVNSCVRTVAQPGYFLGSACKNYAVTIHLYQKVQSDCFCSTIFHHFPSAHYVHNLSGWEKIKDAEDRNLIPKKLDP